MPTYRYRCKKCGEEMEVWQSIKDSPLTHHEADGGELQKVMSPAGIVLKGKGFYKTDSRSKSTSGATKSDGASKDSSSGDSSSKSDSSKSDSSKSDSSKSDSSKSDGASKSETKTSTGSGSGSSSSG